jgi:hypothetical protein
LLIPTFLLEFVLDDLVISLPLNWFVIVNYWHSGETEHGSVEILFIRSYTSRWTLQTTSLVQDFHSLPQARAHAQRAVIYKHAAYIFSLLFNADTSSQPRLWPWELVAQRRSETAIYFK